MKQKVTRDKVLNSIIKFIDEYLSDCVDEDASLGRLNIGLQTVEWMYDWLAEEYSGAKMTRPSKEELKELLNGDTIGKLADIAMKHVEEGVEYDDGEPDPKSEGTTMKTVAFHFTEEQSEGGTVSSDMPPKEMTREEFLKVCSEFYDNRGTHINDFPLMYVKIW